jgi:hypothetical protein
MIQQVKIKTGNTADATAAVIFKAIGVAEAKYEKKFVFGFVCFNRFVFLFERYQQALEGAYATMDSSTFKALRRLHFA